MDAASRERSRPSRVAGARPARLRVGRAPGGSLDPIAALCTDCGLCCDGSLFAHLRLTVDELRALAGRLPVLEEDGRVRIVQPCAALEGRLCRVYEARPGACRRFECLLVSALRDGEVTADEARASLAGIRRALQAFGPDLAEARRAPGLLSSERRAALGALEARLDRELRGRSRGAGR